ncbi:MULTISPECIES: DUF6870 family protein [Lachnospiraceae]|uniref:Uncharacterized protein n=2 Tax=Lachnospiraceae TaxID=186803 RepID=A0AC61RTQ4_9FIRM|nr:MULTISPECIES: hypothetical protein [Lachnospiraceae]TGY95044.1 hypothetical protein E5329_16745 [Petralouisia muris]
MDIHTLRNMAETDISTISKESLIDIKDVTIDMEKGKQERISEFFQQIRNPYCFVCNGIIVKMKYNKNEKTLEEKLDSYFLSL